MKAYITKYALSDGIREVEITTPAGESGVIRVDYNGWMNWFSKPHWHESYDEALKQAESMRVKKIASLKKSIEKLEKLKFTKP